MAPRLRAIERYFDGEMLFFFEAGNVESLADAIKRAADPAARALAVRNAGLFLRRFNWPTHQAALLELYASS